MSELSLYLAGADLDRSRRILSNHREVKPYIWRLVYRNGAWEDQYKRYGDEIAQTMFGSVSKIGVRWIEVFQSKSGKKAMSIEIPNGAEVDILENVETSLSEFGVTEKRIYTFGWVHGEKSEYIHIDPERGEFKKSNARLI